MRIHSGTLPEKKKRKKKSRRLEGGRKEVKPFLKVIFLGDTYTHTHTSTHSHTHIESQAGTYSDTHTHKGHHVSLKP